MNLYFVRHGQSANNAAYDQLNNSTSRVEDPELTGIGRRQAQYVAQFLAQSDPGAPVKGRDHQNRRGYGITHVYSSMMVRAVATGHTIAAALNLPLVAWEDWHEAGGIYLDDESTGGRTGLPGKTRSYFEQHYPGFVLPERLDESGWWNRPFEEVEHRPARARRALADLLRQHANTDDNVVVVSHGEFFNLLIAEMMKLPGIDGWWFVLNNASVSRLRFDGEGEVGISYVNRVDFLPTELIT